MERAFLSRYCVASLGTLLSTMNDNHSLPPIFVLYAIHRWKKEQTPAVSPRHVPTPSDFFRFLEEPIATETNGGKPVCTCSADALPF